MSAVSAVVFFALIRALMAGYHGPWFLPVVAGETVDASLAFVCVAIAHWALRGLGRGDRDAAAPVMHVVTYVILFAAFGRGWVEPHATLSTVIGMDAKLNPALIFAGVVVGLVAERLAPAGREARSVAFTWATAGWLIVGSEIYARFDHVLFGRRLLALVGIALGFIVLALVIESIGRLLGPRGARRLAAAAAATAVVASALVPGGHGERALDKPRPSFLLVVVDTLRADALDGRATDGTPLMPRLRELGESGIRFTNAVAPAPWTLPSAATILSGMNPLRHRVGAMAAGMPLPGRGATFHLAPSLREEGYQVAGFANNPWLRPYYGFDEGFLHFRRYHGNAHDGTEIALSWMSGHDYRPFFVFLHLMDPHWPYEAPDGFGEERADCEPCDDLVTLQYRPTDAGVRREVRRRYEAEVLFTDFEIGRLRDGMKAAGLLDHTWLIITSDHGEELWDHRGFLHGHTLYDELLRVPLLVVPPRGAGPELVGKVIDRQVRLEDIAPTIMELAGIEPDDMPPDSPRRLDGRSLLVYSRQPSAAIAQRLVVAGFLQSATKLQYAVRTERFKLVQRADNRWPTLFDLAADAQETRSVLKSRPLVAGLLRKAPATLGLDPQAYIDSGPLSGASDSIDADLRRELRSLGYIE